MTKSEVSKEFARLQKLNFKVWNFNNNNALRSGMKDFVDFLIVSTKYIIFVEIKIEDTKDKLSPGQKETQFYLSSAAISNRHTHYRLLTDMKSVKALVDNLLQGNL